MEQSPDVLDLILNQMKLEISNNLKKQYKKYRIDDKIEEIIDELLESELDLKKINKKYKKPDKKMEIEDDPIDYCKCMARRWRKGLGGQCTRYKLKGTKFCPRHQTEEQRWCGIITEKRKKEIYPPLTQKEKETNFIKKPHKWNN